MGFRPMLGVSLALVLLSVGASRAQLAAPEGDRSGKGAVLCAWALLDAARAAGRECFKGQDPAFQAELDGQLARIDAFIVKNSVAHPTSQPQLEERRARALKQLHAAGDFCASDAARLYQALHTNGVDRLHAGMDELLSVPREPVMNPCL